jgi:hypothetical protein
MFIRAKNSIESEVLIIFNTVISETVFPSHLVSTVIVLKNSTEVKVKSLQYPAGGICADSNYKP